MGDAKVAPTKTQRSPGAAWRRAAFERLEAARPRRKTRAQATRLEVERASAYYALNEAAIPDGLVAARRRPRRITGRRLPDLFWRRLRG